MYPVVEDAVSKKSFFYPSFGELYQVIRELYLNDIFPSKVSLLVELERRGILNGILITHKGLRGKDAIDYLEAIDVDPDQIESYAFQVQEFFASRELERVLQEELKMLEKGDRVINILAHNDLQTGKIGTYTGAKSQNIQSAKEVRDKALQQLKETADGAERYIPVGIKAWDDYTNGLFGGRMYIVAASSNDGKSSLVQNIVYNVSVIKNIKTCLISLESSSVEVYNKIIQRMTGISILKIEKGVMSDKELDLYEQASERIGNAPIIFDDSPELILPLLRSKIRKAKADGARAIIIDQLEQVLIGGGGDTQPEYIRLNYIAYRIKAFAREMDIPIVLVHQMNRSADSGTNRGKNINPQIQDLAQAGEKPADAVLMIRHERVNQTVVSTFFHWVKNRQGKKGMEEVEFIGERVLFRDKGTSERDRENTPEAFQEKMWDAPEKTD